MYTSVAPDVQSRNSFVVPTTEFNSTLAHTELIQRKKKKKRRRKNNESNVQYKSNLLHVTTLSLHFYNIETTQPSFATILLTRTRLEKIPCLDARVRSQSAIPRFNSRKKNNR